MSYRYMDDWVVLVKTRRQLRKVVKLTHGVMDYLKLQLHPDKTFIGKVAKGINFLGYQLSPQGIGIAKVSVERAIKKIVCFYETIPREFRFSRVAIYLKRWCGRLKWIHRYNLKLTVSNFIMFSPSSQSFLVA